MTAAKAKLAQGTLLAVADDDAGANARYIAEVTSISGPTMSSDLIDVTSQESSGGFREKIIGLTDPGELSFDIFFNQTLTSHGTGAQGLLGIFNSKAIKSWQLVLPSGATPSDATHMGIWMFKGVVNGFEIDASVDDALKASVTIAVSGLPNFSATIWSTIAVPGMALEEEADMAARAAKGEKLRAQMQAKGVQT